MFHKVGVSQRMRHSTIAARNRERKTWVSRLSWKVVILTRRTARNLQRVSGRWWGIGFRRRSCSFVITGGRMLARAAAAPTGKHSTSCLRENEKDFSWSIVNDLNLRLFTNKGFWSLSWNEKVYDETKRPTIVLGCIEFSLMVQVY